eukprot:m.309156 g.309156  ORF g.309156 m.309156 type:complete len:180 (+) comp45644_c0_seq1:24-563(+)
MSVLALARISSRYSLRGIHSMAAMPGSAISGKKLSVSQSVCFQTAMKRPVIYSGSQRMAATATVEKEKSAVSHWTAERVVAVAQIGFVGSAFMIGSHPIVDWGLAVTIPLHSYWGLGSIITDYTRKIFGNHVANVDRLKDAIKSVWAGFSLLSFAGFAYLNYYDVGISKAVYLLWTQVQ